MKIKEGINTNRGGNYSRLGEGGIIRSANKRFQIWWVLGKYH